MALSNSQYDAIMREYGKQQMENQHSQEAVSYTHLTLPTNSRV